MATDCEFMIHELCIHGHNVGKCGRTSTRNCKDCVAIYQRKQGLKKRYSMSLEEYNTKFAEQNGLCPGCLRHQTSVLRHFAVDEDPLFKNTDTPKLRGLLCTNCNRGIEYLKDNPKVLRRMADYLEKWGK